MILIRHKLFLKHFKARILRNKALVKRFELRLNLFLENPKSPVLKDHQLTGRLKDFRAFWVAGDVRVVYWLEGDTLYLYDIGSHN